MSRLRANQITNENANGAPNFPHGLTVTGIVTATTGGQSISGDLTVSGNTTLTGNLGVGGTITYEDVANVDSVGIITSIAGVNITGGNITLGDSGGSSDDRIKLGASGDLQIYHNGSASNYIAAASGHDIHINADAILLKNSANNETYAYFQNNDRAELYFNNSKKIETTTAGVTITGGVTVTGTVTDSKGDVRSIPLNSKSSAYTLVASDAGKAIYISSGGVTIPASVMASGNAVTIINDSGSDQTLTQGSGLTLYNSTDASTGNRTLAQRGMATVYFSATATAFISGAGLS